MLHGGGPGASAWSNFGSALPRFAASFRTLLVDQPGFGGSDKPPVVGNYFRFSADYVVALLDELGHRAGPPPGQQPGRRYGEQARDRVPRPGRAADPDGPGRALAQPLPRRPDRGRQAAHGVQHEPHPRGAAGVHLDHGRQPGPRHRRAGGGAVRRRDRARRPRGDDLDGHVVLRPRQRRGRHALARRAQDPQAHAADLGPRGPGQPAGRRHGRAQGDPQGHAARVPQLRPLGPDRGRRRVRRDRDQLPGATRREAEEGPSA